MILRQVLEKHLRPQHLAVREWLSEPLEQSACRAMGWLADQLCVIACRKPYSSAQSSRSLQRYRSNQVCTILVSETGKAATLG